MSIPTTTREYRLPKVDGIHNLQVQEGSIKPPGDSEVLVKIYAVSLQFRDLLVAQGRYSPNQKKNVVPCSDMSGEVIAVGSNVKKFKVGDRVCSNLNVDHVFGDITEETISTGLGGYIDGVLTEYKVFPVHCLVHAPCHLTHTEASTLPCAGLTAYNALHGPTPIKGGDIVLVQGTGGMSIFALQFALACGANVIVISSSDDKLSLAKSLGARWGVNYKKCPEWDQEVMTTTKGRGVDHILEVGGKGTFEKSMKCVRYAGWVHVIGFIAGVNEGTSGGGNVPKLIQSKAVMVRGIQIGSRAQFEEMNRLIVARNIKPVVDHVFEFEQAREAFEYLSQQKHVGKVIIRVVKREEEKEEVCGDGCSDEGCRWYP
ncbi:hypothetical protein JAAARDRAFT_35041 [Jaapia argillacea MUCL 33604]|uniref:Enoyl reductase (ER) domain-containing protein n=1 Tax=Jaapia argillacea MUCL 33604 TaxID=933084 RepID=A0A067Q6K1_9AGAM|nr:hypothetical protein JAAARDRAFT_35041 [Jaapia argillacea MUCL 33604]